MDGLAAFALAAKAACYVGDGAKARASRIGAHDLTFASGDWAYRDSYFGGTDFLGQEVVWHRSRPVWAMNYHGFIHRDDLMTGADGGRVIKAALSAMYAEGRFLGGFRFRLGPFAYQDDNQGDVLRFDGVETIRVDGIKAYRLLYHGGLIRV
ncbi:DUF5680 domain-containing protein [Neogemmobacter tilapiae]|uniref:DUF5680 domain-containing protein n=1 Tax=Neogemmobacter tilapiae TaxID=875041 RepID=A0A918WMX3_9RHOB|nr:DUF5680 domain-containing protein [Gemmobacter tilapiae]GHC60794.1 hypothetical protein GCM10007315_25860 [Gemmobacter tilapiae]